MDNIASQAPFLFGLRRVGVVGEEVEVGDLAPGRFHSDLDLLTVAGAGLTVLRRLILLGLLLPFLAPAELQGIAG
jgi:hypothetical protein